MQDLLRHKVRFGELSWGPYVHHSRLFDWLIRATEELSYELGEPVESTVEAGGVPFAPVAIRGEMTAYPRYEDTVVVAGEPTAVGESNLQMSYRFRRAADGAEFGRATMVQVTITPEHTAEPISPGIREQLAALGDLDGDPTRIDPAGPVGDGPVLAREMTFRTPHVEAAGLGYFEDYAREFSICLEDHLDAQGRSLRALTGEVVPFVPVAWDLTIERSIAFEDDVDVVGRVTDVDDRAVRVGYAFERADTGERCIAADLTYGCFDRDGARVAFPDEAIVAVEGT